MNVRAVPPWLLLSVPILVGVGVMVERQASVARWGVHLCAGLFGLALFGALAVVRPLRPAVRWGLAIAGFLVIASTLVSPGIEGMQRWHQLGPLRVHPSALLAPALLMFAAGAVTRRGAAHGFLLALQALHLAQPDAGQATALGCGALGLLLTDSRQRAKLPLAALYGVSVAVCWLRPDPLPPAAFVEDIVSQAFALGTFAGLAALLSLALLLVSPVVGERAERCRPATAALFGYFAGSLIAPILGEFPVPLLGFGTSPVVGAFLGVGALNRLRSPDGVPEAKAHPQRSHTDDPHVCQQAVPAQ